MLDELKRPEYIHVLLNPLPVYATAMGVIALAVALLQRSRPAQLTGLLIILIGCGSVWPVIEYGEKGYDRVYSMSNAAGQKWLDVHADRAHDAEWFFYVVAALAVASMLTNWKWPKAGRWLTWATLAAALVCVGLGGWIAHAGGKIRHTEFRD
jgi:predicted membrane channel-forming protein YqfA (hemolysin III family)